VARRRDGEEEPGPPGRLRPGMELPFPDAGVVTADHCDFLYYCATARTKNARDDEDWEKRDIVDDLLLLELVSDLVPIERCVAAHFVAALHYRLVAEEWTSFLFRRHQGQDGEDGGEGTSALEEGAVLVAQCLTRPVDLLKAPSRNELSWRHQKVLLERELDRLAEQLRYKIQERQGSSTSELGGDNDIFPVVDPMVAVRELRSILVDELGITGNDQDYYNPLNLSLPHVLLRSHRGMPVTLCILWKALLRRVGVHAGVTGLPGHVVLGIDEDTFVDTFRNGAILSLAEVREIVRSYNVEWDPRFAAPLSEFAVYVRLVHNMYHCIQRSVYRPHPGPGPTSLQMNLASFMANLPGRMQHRGAGVGVGNHGVDEEQHQMLRLPPDVGMMLESDILRHFGSS